LPVDFVAADSGALGLFGPAHSSSLLTAGALVEPETDGVAMSQAKSGDTVRIHYTGTLSGGEIFDSSEGRDPLEFKLGGGQVIPGLESEIEGMQVGEKKSIAVSPADGYGDHHPEGVQKVPRGDFPPDMELNIGLELTATSPEGKSMRVKVIEIGEAEVTLDANHPLAGNALVFDVELIEIAA